MFFLVVSYSLQKHLGFWIVRSCKVDSHTFLIQFFNVVQDTLQYMLTLFECQREALHLLENGFRSGIQARHVSEIIHFWYIILSVLNVNKCKLAQSYLYGYCITAWASYKQKRWLLVWKMITLFSTRFLSLCCFPGKLWTAPGFLLPVHGIVRSTRRKVLLQPWFITLSLTQTVLSFSYQQTLKMILKEPWHDVHLNSFLVKVS